MVARADELSGASADEIREAIEQKREELSSEIDALGDRVSPKQVVRRLRQDSLTVARFGWNRLLEASAADASLAPGSTAARAPDPLIGSAPNTSSTVVLDERAAFRLAAAMLFTGFVLGRFFGRRRRRR